MSRNTCVSWAERAAQRPPGQRGGPGTGLTRQVTPNCQASWFPHQLRAWEEDQDLARFSWFRLKARDPSQCPQQPRAQQQAHGGLAPAQATVFGTILRIPSRGQDTGLGLAGGGGRSQAMGVMPPNSWGHPGTWPTVETGSESYREAVNVLGEEPYLRHSTFRRGHL